MIQTTTHTHGSVDALSFTDGPWAGIIFTYSSVRFIENDDETVTMKFGYDILENPNNIEIDKGLFEKELGDHLVDLLQMGVDDNSLVYTGGT